MVDNKRACHQTLIRPIHHQAAPVTGMRTMADLFIKNGPMLIDLSPFGSQGMAVSSNPFADRLTNHEATA